MTEHERYREVERYLYRLVGIASRVKGIPSSEEPCNLRLNIHEAGSWLIKFKENGHVILNNCDLIMTTDAVQVDACISFVTCANFWATVNGHLRFEAGVSRSEGSEKAMLLFKQKIFNTSVQETSSTLSTKSIARAQIQQDQITSFPIKSGWLIKRGDMMQGWKQRYFKIYIGRVEYFVDPLDEVPRAVIPLLEAKISTPTEVRNRLHNRGVYHQIVVDPKYHEKSFKLISPRKGAEGLVEIKEWTRAFEVATKPADQAAKLLRTDTLSAERVQAGAGFLRKANLLVGAGGPEGGEPEEAADRVMSGKVRETIRRSLSGAKLILEEPVSTTLSAIVAICMVALLRAILYYQEVNVEEFSVVTITAVVGFTTYTGWDLGGKLHPYYLSFSDDHADNADIFYTTSTTDA